MLLASSVIPNGYEVLYGSQDKIFQRLQTKSLEKDKSNIKWKQKRDEIFVSLFLFCLEKL